MRGIIILAGIAMAASFGMTWLEPPFAGPHLSPFVMLQEGILSIGADTSWQAWLFLGGFVSAALAALLSMRGGGGGLFALIAGASPIVVLGDALFRANDLRTDLGLPIPIDFGDLAQSWEVLQDFARLGLWAYLGGAVILLVAGLSSVFAARR